MLNTPATHTVASHHLRFVFAAAWGGQSPFHLPLPHNPALAHNTHLSSALMRSNSAATRAATTSADRCAIILARAARPLAAAAAGPATASRIRARRWGSRTSAHRPPCNQPGSDSGTCTCSLCVYTQLMAGGQGSTRTHVDRRTYQWTMNVAMNEGAGHRESMHVTA
jgi:hypothetical protein